MRLCGMRCAKGDDANGATAERGAVSSEGRCDLEAGCWHPRGKLDRGRGTRRCPIPALPSPSGNVLECRVVALLGTVVQATTFVARLVIIPILTATRSAEDWFSGSLSNAAAIINNSTEASSAT